ncbi:MAG: MFS transporter [bacterium]
MKPHRDPNLRIIIFVTLMAVLGISSIAPALPAIARALDISPQRIGWLITAFTLPGIFLTPVLGVLADRYGRKRILVPSLMLFGLAGSACGLTSDFQWLCLFRFFQGIGAAALGMLNVTLIGDLFTGRERAAAMGYNASILSLGTAVFPAIGGGLAQLDWHYPFWLALAAIPAGLLVIFRLHNPEPLQHQSWREYLGGVRRGILRRQVFGLFAVSTLTFLLLFGSYLTFFPLLMDEKFAASPAVIGLLLSSSSLATMVAAASLGRLTRRFRATRLMQLGFMLYFLSLALIPFLPGLLWLLLPSLLFGAGMGLNMPSLMTLLTGLAPLEHRAAFMSLNGMVLRLGQTLGPPVMAVMYSYGGMPAPFLGGAVVALVGWLVLAVVVKEPAVEASSRSGTSNGDR